ncbi:MAG: S10 family peptidase [Acidimicrobiia bacterium]
MADEAKTSDAPAFELPKGSTTQAVWPAPDGSEVRYTAEASWMALRDEHDEPVADIFSVSYLSDGADAGTRPVTFVFNGGPGASSAYLHVGALGPRRVAFDERGAPLAPPSGLVDNAESWLAFTDLVFVDPVGTGWSRAVRDDGDAKEGGAKKERDPKAFFGINKDLDSLVELMTRWLSGHDRWASPVFVAGESYGGFRAAKLARLANERGIGLNGTVLISPALEFALLDPSDYDVLPWVDLVPTMALAAAHHGRSRAFDAGADPAEVREAAEAFATGPLATALIRGATMPADERADVVRRLAELIGLDEEVVDRHECRISMTRFARELLRDEGRIVGLYDATAVGRDPFPDRDGMPWPDPTLSGIERVFNAGINARLRTELGVSTDREYRLLSMAVNRDWKIDFDQHALESQVGATDDLRYGMALNPHMKVFLTHGLYDMVTPYFASDRLRNLLRLDEASAAALTTQHFHGGHMFYAWEDSRVAFRDALAEFYAGALG